MQYFWCVAMYTRDRQRARGEAVHGVCPGVSLGCGAGQTHSRRTQGVRIARVETREAGRLSSRALVGRFGSTYSTVSMKGFNQGLNFSAKGQTLQSSSSEEHDILWPTSTVPYWKTRTDSYKISRTAAS